ncbi:MULTISPECIES: MbtH family protein [Streptomyces]|uniref:MbtH family protein n=1 Tax=Streptomyces TaxID=1883 RepID=UPI00081DCD69|nr:MULTISPECIES: MbtH family protein [Streptomyces]OSC74132.1 hypothetical protein B5180_14505 [Streptomyces sp. BF-3]KAA6199078.1 MbtH family NRPS accessory protein [Streptomyces parvus]PVC90281.1 hypothetical protein DBP20_04160 [Streptomyces sp. CS131]UCA50332.1 MbtH family NRPS accessory protein [Streptomyces sp. WA6-1-16]SCF58007.1 MbtH protein [Streptomyces sp. Cmuel-A718b]
MDGTVENAQAYVVVVNAEGQHSIWPAHRDVPEGWQDINVRGSREECLDHIEREWTDMRPLSLRGQ